MRRRVTCALVCAAIAAGCQRPSPQEAPARAASSAPRAARANARLPAPDGAAANEPRAPKVVDLDHRARELADRLILLDGHIDTPYRLENSRDAAGKLTDDISSRSKRGDFDYERARRGGLDVPFMSIYVPARFERRGAKRFADKLIDLVERFASEFPQKFALARSPADVRKNAAEGKISLAMGMENGSPIERQLRNVAYFHARGIRYITLTHSRDNHIGDSSYDARRTHRGLSSFGEQLVREMNRVGIMIDVSHVSDDTFWQVIEQSRLPVIASHSSCRHFTPGWPRNMNDEMIVALAKAGGVIQINFGSAFLDDTIRREETKRQQLLAAALRRRGLDSADPRAAAVKEQLLADHPVPRASIERVADHIDHVRKLVGIRHIGLGSDFDGVGDTLPVGLTDVSQYPNLIRVLLERGYDEEQIEAICSGNVLRVWQTAEDFARQGASGL
jgi:membrane dipeptidase